MSHNDDKQAAQITNVLIILSSMEINLFSFCYNKNVTSFISVYSSMCSYMILHVFIRFNKEIQIYFLWYLTDKKNSENITLKSNSTSINIYK